MKKIKELAEQIVKLEKEYQVTRNSALMGEMEKIISNLSLTELCELDDYILSNYNLKN